jgi:hypothetical protein
MRESSHKPREKSGETGDRFALVNDGRGTLEAGLLGKSSMKAVAQAAKLK